VKVFTFFFSFSIELTTPGYILFSIEISLILKRKPVSSLMMRQVHIFYGEKKTEQICGALNKNGIIPRNPANLCFRISVGCGVTDIYNS